MRRAHSFFLRLGAVFCCSAPASAQDFGSIDANGLPAAPTPGTFQSLAPSQALERGEFALGLRSSYLLRPIDGSQPSPSPQGTTSRVVEHLWLAEALVGYGLLRGLDVGLAVPIHIYQQGSGLSAIGVGDPLASPAFGDPRLTVGFELPVPFALRAYGTLFVPLGDEQSFAGERAVRTDLGAVSAFRWQQFELEVELGVRLRETSQIGLTRWGPQAKLGVGGAFWLTEQLTVAGELNLAPTLFEQPSAGNPTVGYLLPAEALLSTTWALERLRLGAVLGTGLPLSIPSGESAEAGVRRGPTSPVLRLGVEVRSCF